MNTGMVANMDYRTYLMEKDEAEYERELEAERIERERAEEDAECARQLAEEAELPRITTRPVQFVSTMQGNLFTEGK